MNLNTYDHVIVYFSGGKDSLACLLHVLEFGVDPAKIELWHHEVDGREGSTLMDWPSTPSYCRAVANAFNIPIFFSWKIGGFEREMLRCNSLTAPTRFETPDGVDQVGGTRGKRNTRRKFPQVSANLSVRWCSAYLKIDVGAAALRNQPRLNGGRVLTISGERAEESAARAHYQTFEPDRTDNRDGTRIKRHVDRWRPVHAWPEGKVWDIIERHRVNPHPAYHLGWGRVSCMTCIFGSDSQWASVAEIAPHAIGRIAEYEREFGLTIHRSLPVEERVNRGIPYPMNGYVGTALAQEYDKPIFLIDDWTLPAGAFGESCGPT